MSLHVVPRPTDDRPTLDRTPARAPIRMPPAPRGVRERIGEFLGRSWAPAITAISTAREARMFHPCGHVYSGRAEAIVGGAYAALAAQLEGHVLARCSAALWKHSTGHELSPRRFDVLGIALRFRRDQPITDHQPSPGDQDLLFATIRSPFTMVISPFTTDTSDFAANRYFAVSPFAILDGERVELRLRPAHPMKLEGPRDYRLWEAVRMGRAAWWLEARRTLTRHWHTIVRVTLEAPLDVDQEALRFDPFRTGAGVVPVGLVHAIRRAVYPASQRGRPASRQPV
jgi:hypothetical protein